MAAAVCAVVIAPTSHRLQGDRRGAKRSQPAQLNASRTSLPASFTCSAALRACASASWASPLTTRLSLFVALPTACFALPVSSSASFLTFSVKLIVNPPSFLSLSCQCPKGSDRKRHGPDHDQ